MPIKLKNNEEFYRKWYRENKGLYESCMDETENLINHLLENENVSKVYVTSRIKEEKSFINKCNSEKYINPIGEITDIIGIRIVLYTKSDVEEVSKLIEEEFKIDWDNSLDKADIMKINEVGYLSVHYIAELVEKHYDIATFKRFKDEGIKFEIQIRTILQHAWAELEHDQNYKYNGILPEHLRRKFTLLAAGLELIDNNFDNMRTDLGQYIVKTERKIFNGDLDFKLDTISLRTYFRYLEENKFFSTEYDYHSLISASSHKELVLALNEYGFDTLEDLDDFLRENNEIFYDLESKVKAIYKDDKGNIGGNLIFLMYVLNLDKFKDKENKYLNMFYRSMSILTDVEEIADVVNGLRSKIKE